MGERDVTPEATKKVLEKEISGVAEILRAYGQRRTPLSMLSRAVAGIRGTTMIVKPSRQTSEEFQNLWTLSFLGYCISIRC